MANTQRFVFPTMHNQVVADTQRFVFPTLQIKKKKKKKESNCILDKVLQFLMLICS